MAAQLAPGAHVHCRFLGFRQLDGAFVDLRERGRRCGSICDGPARRGAEGCGGRLQFQSGVTVVYLLWLSGLVGCVCLCVSFASTMRTLFCRFSSRCFGPSALVPPLAKTRTAEIRSASLPPSMRTPTAGVGSEVPSEGLRSRVDC